MKKNNLILYFAAIAIPLTSTESWVQLKYKSIPVHQISSSAEGMQINVQKSAMPLIYSTGTKLISGFKVKVNFQNFPQINPITSEGQKKFDDYPLRIGFVLSGDKRLSWGQKLIAADWIKKLFSLAPADKGIDKIQFYNFVQNTASLGQKRVHPLSDLIEENFQFLAKKGTDQTETITFAKPISIEAVWISIDGDDTKSDFSLTLKELELVTP